MQKMKTWYKIIWDRGRSDLGPGLEIIKLASLIHKSYKNSLLRAQKKKLMQMKISCVFSKTSYNKPPPYYAHVFLTQLVRNNMYM